MAIQTAIVIGAGIVGLATARALAAKGTRVTVIERSQRASGASVRNFGMIWPIGQPGGELYEMAIRSRSHWKSVCAGAGIWYEQQGSMHLAYEREEWDVLHEIREIYRKRPYTLLSAEKAADRSPAANAKGLLGALYSSDELIVDPREALLKIPKWLEEKYGVEFVWGRAVTDIGYPSVYAGREAFEADEIYICNGADFETLYPEQFSAAPFTRCKLQMMRIEAQRAGWRIGPSLCGGLSLLHYSSFKEASSLEALRRLAESEYPQYLQWGIHVMVSQNEGGELTIGDSHEYGAVPDPFDKQAINELILDYLERFAKFRNKCITETWQGVYSKLTDGQPFLVLEPESGVTIINGLGGAGMTLSFGLCDQLIGSKKIKIAG